MTRPTRIEDGRVECSNRDSPFLAPGPPEFTGDVVTGVSRGVRDGSSTGSSDRRTVISSHSVSSEIRRGPYFHQLVGVRSRLKSDFTPFYEGTDSVSLLVRVWHLGLRSQFPELTTYDRQGRHTGVRLVNGRDSESVKKRHFTLMTSDGNVLTVLRVHFDRDFRSLSGHPDRRPRNDLGGEDWGDRRRRGL